MEIKTSWGLFKRNEKYALLISAVFVILNYVFLKISTLNEILISAGVTVLALSMYAYIIAQAQLQDWQAKNGLVGTAIRVVYHDGTVDEFENNDVCLDTIILKNRQGLKIESIDVAKPVILSEVLRKYGKYSVEEIEEELRQSQSPFYYPKRLLNWIYRPFGKKPFKELLED